MDLFRLEKIPNLFVMLGLILLVASLVLTVIEKDPVKFVEAVELFMKVFLSRSNGNKHKGTYAAQAAAEYGFGVIESMVASLDPSFPPGFSCPFFCLLHIEAEDS